MAPPRKRPPRQNAAQPEPIRYLVTRGRDQEFVIEVPADWKITFGWVNPSAGKGGYGDHSGNGHCLRVYEGEKLRGVWADVRGFRDLSIPLATKVSRETGSATWTSDSEGNFVSEKSLSLEESFKVEDQTDEITF